MVERALALQYRLVKLDQEKRDYQSDLALSFNNLGAILLRQSQWAAAERQFQDAIKIQTLLYKTAPGVTAYGRDLAVSYNNLGMTQSSAGKLDAAAEAFAEALEVQQLLVHRHRQDLSLKSGLGGIFNNLGMVHQSAGRPAEACIAFEEAIDYQRQALERAPHVTQFRESLSKHYYNYAQVLRSLDRLDAALDATLARRELWRANADRLLRVAEELATTCKEVAPGTIRERYLHETMSTLEAAMDAGLQSLPDPSEDPFDVLTDAPHAGQREVSRS
jgi:tetratricopeptide (TPR) repeat protein